MSNIGVFKSIPQLQTACKLSIWLPAIRHLPCRRYILYTLLLDFSDSLVCYRGYVFLLYFYLSQKLGPISDNHSARPLASTNLNIQQKWNISTGASVEYNGVNVLHYIFTWIHSTSALRNAGCYEMVFQQTFNGTCRKTPFSRARSEILV